MSIHQIKAQNNNNYSLEIYTLGNFTMTSNNRVVSYKNKRSHRTWEVFKYLLSNKGYYLFPEQVMETLSPNQQYAEPGTTFRFHIHKIRKYFNENSDYNGSVNIISSGGGYCLELGSSCWLDVEEFENYSNKARVLSRCNSNAEAVEAFLNAINLYKGGYLPELDSSWVIPLQNYYRSLYLKNLLDLFGLLKEREKDTEIIELCEKAFLVEPFEEELHLIYLETLIKTGNTKKALSHYEHITGSMYRELGIKPSNRIRELYYRIKSDLESFESDFKSFQKAIKAQEEVNGALYCSSRDFRLFCMLEKRRMERYGSNDGSNAFLAILTLSVLDSCLPSRQIKNTVKLLEYIVLNNLRKGDVVAKWEHNQLLLLLPGLTYEQMRKVIRRIYTEFNLPGKKGISLQFNSYPLLDS